MTYAATWDEWLATLPAADRDAAITLLQKFELVDADDPESWARSEMSEGIPQLSRLMVLRRMWKRAINLWEAPGALEGMYFTKKLLDAGADRDHLTKAMRAAAYDAAFAAIYVLDEGYDPDLPDDWPGWCLVETSDDEVTGRKLGGLHESFLSADPSGHEGEGLWG